MPRAVWIILGSVAGLVAVLLIGAAIAIATVDPNRFVAPLAARIKAETGRTLTVGGPVAIKLSLEPRVVLPGVAFANAPWSKPAQMLTAKRIEAQIALLPLLSRRFEVVQFIVVEPTIALETDASGRGNWEFEKPGMPAAGGAGGAPSAAGVGIGNFEIRDGTLTYRSAGGTLMHAAIERLMLRARDMQAPVAFEFRGTVEDVPIALSGDLGSPDRWLRQQWPYPLALEGNVDGNRTRLTAKLSRAATTTRLDDIDAVFGALAAKGSLHAIEEAGHTRYAIDLALPTVSVAELPAFGRAQAGKGGAAAPPPSGRFIVPDAPLPLAPLAAVAAEGAIAIGELKLRGGQTLSDVTTRFTSRDGKLDARFTAAKVMGGTLRGELAFDGRHGEAPDVRLELDAQDLDLPALAAAAGIRRDIRGGKVRASVDINGRGATPHRVASTMSGSILVVSGPATLGRAAGQGESALAQLAGALDPLQTVDAATELRCAVFRLPLKDGIAHVDRSIAVETGKVAASASGTLDFRDETLDLSVQPQLRSGVKLDVSQIASLVRIRGRFDKPSVAVDVEKSAELLAKIGALGAAGGGLASIGGALFGATSEPSAPCAVALTGKAPREPKPAPAAKGKAPVPELGLPQDVGKALGKLFGR
ncbi:MAG: AsmA family protein [Rudaea sp.]